jgi:methionyl-tRNA formyltransferase
MIKYILLTEKNWHQKLFDNLLQRKEESWELISNKEDFCLDLLDKICPEKIFIPHWSYIIPSEIFNKYDCIVFHMTDLPYGRGGSPLQNLILKGHSSTKLTALKVEEGIDTGNIYLKKSLSLEGTAREIFSRSAEVMQNMIIEIIENKIIPIPQVGEPVLFKRRKPKESSIENLNLLGDVYDYIRMLDCDGYPKAFIETSDFRFEFSNASLNNDEILANVRIFKK